MRRHRTDIVSLVAGLLFGFLAVFFVLDQLDVGPVSGAGLRWIPAVVLLAFGSAGITTSLARDARSRRDGDAA